jgi:XTP/dITP diphosphohydrolase
MENVDPAERSARFRCVLALSTPYSDQVQTVEGSCSGTIARAPRGSGGFGYDPLFVVDEQGGRSMAELSEDEKNRVSHRSVAVRRLKPVVVELVRQLLEGAGRALHPGS